MGEWDAVIDVSNVCWSPHLPPVGRRQPRWSRLGLVMDAWRALHGAVRFDLVADESLVRHLDDVGEFRRLRKAGVLTTQQVADALILELARDRGLHVITRDHYVDHRVEHPWIERAPHRFHGWSVENGVTRIVPLGIVPRSRQTISRVRERKELGLTARLDPANPRDLKILGTRWKCDNHGCPEAAHWQDQLLVWPMVTRTRQVVCPTCREPLSDLGPRDPIYEAVVEVRDSGREVMRFPLEAGCRTEIGRGSRTRGVVNLGVYGAAEDDALRQAIRRVSRRHLQVWLDAQGTNRRLVAVDLDSRNRTEVERWAGRSFEPARVLPAGRQVFLGLKDRLVLGGAVTVRLSGRRFVTKIRTAESNNSATPRYEGTIEA